MIHSLIDSKYYWKNMALCLSLREFTHQEIWGIQAKLPAAVDWKISPPSLPPSLSSCIFSLFFLHLFRSISFFLSFVKFIVAWWICFFIFIFAIFTLLLHQTYFFILFVAKILYLFASIFFSFSSTHDFLITLSHWFPLFFILSPVSVLYIHFWSYIDRVQLKPYTNVL